MDDWQTDDDRMMAYLDGAMDDAQAAAFERELEERPELAEQLSRFASNDALLRQAFDEPVPQSLTQTVRAMLDQAPVAAGLFASNDNPRGWKRWQWPAIGTVAAAAAAAFMMIGMPVGSNDGMDPILVAMLDRLPSGQTGDLGQGQSLTLQLTATAADGRYCREFVRSGGPSEGTGLACRTAGQWKLEAFVAQSTARNDDMEIRTAGGDTSPEIDAAYARLGLSDPIASDRENDIISNGWLSKEK
jgi:hypothetical protein